MIGFRSAFKNMNKNISSKRIVKRNRRHARIRAKVVGSPERPRLSVYKSNRFVYAQLIDDEKGATICEASSLKEKKGTMLEHARKVGESIGKKALQKNVDKVVFDRGGFLYAGHIKAVAEGARSSGLKF